jgi:porin
VALGVGVMTSRAVPSARAQTAAVDSGASHGLSTAFSYTGELVGDVAGGARRGTAYTGALAAQLTFDPRRLVGWRGARLFVFALGTHGGAPSDVVGDVQGVSNLQAPAAARVEELWLQQNLLRGRFSWLVGRYDLNSEFYRLQSAGLFANSSFGIGPELAQSGVAGPSIYPRTAVGTRVAFKPSRAVVWRAAVLNGAPVDRAGGGVRLFARGEVAILARPDTAGEPRDRRFRIGRGATRAYVGKVALGTWSYTARFPDLVDTLPDGTPVRHRGSRGAYLIADRAVWSAARGRPSLLTAFVQLGVGDARVNQIGGYVGGGLTLTGPLTSRAQDELGLGVAAARNGPHFVRARAAPRMPSAGETAAELTYLAHIGARLSVQPDVQYILDPGGSRAMRSALVPGLRVAVSP